MNQDAQRSVRVIHHLESLPTKVLTATEFSKELRDRGIALSPERLTELADAYFIPHYRIEAGPPLFASGEARKWIAGNLVQHIEGHVIPKKCTVLVHAVPGADARAVPLCLRGIADRLILVPEPVIASGIYMLCCGNSVTYVGQSMCTGGRIANHRRDGKHFDRAYVFPTPADQLAELEGAFIRALRPPENAICPPDYGSDSLMLPDGLLEQEGANPNPSLSATPVGDTEKIGA